MREPLPVAQPSLTAIRCDAAGPASDYRVSTPPRCPGIAVPAAFARRATLTPAPTISASPYPAGVCRAIKLTPTDTGAWSLYATSAASTGRANKCGAVMPLGATRRPAARPMDHLHGPGGTPRGVGPFL